MYLPFDVVSNNAGLPHLLLIVQSVEQVQLVTAEYGSTKVNPFSIVGHKISELFW